MKKLALGCVLTLAALGLMAAPAMAADSPQTAPALSAADQAFIASLAAPAPVEAAKRPAIHGKALCSATANCVGGGTVSCSGNNSTTSCTGVDGNCSVNEPGHVTCDGITTWCANTCSCNCSVERSNCANDCYPCSFTFSCSLSTCPGTCHCNFSGCKV